MLVTTIAENSLAKYPQIIQTHSQDTDVFEFRIDHLLTIDLDVLAQITHQLNHPVIFTLRTTSPNLELTHQLANLKPDYFDFEADFNNQFIEDFHQLYPNIKIIRSYHNFENTPENLASILTQLQHPNIYGYKIVTLAHSTIDCLKLLNFVKQYSAKIKLIGHCMGQIGLPSRILGAIAGNYFYYAGIDDKQSATGYIKPNILNNLYRIKQLNQDSQIFALLGNPVEHSIGDIFHNKLFKQKDLNAVYIKLPLLPDELNEFFKLINQLPFAGFSITMPLKTAILPYIDFIDCKQPNVQAMNTISINGAQLYATNTDGLGAIEAIQQITHINNRHVLIFGAGGSARAIAIQAKLSKPASITIINRTLTKANQLVSQLADNAYVEDINNIKLASHPPRPADIIINTLPLEPIDIIQLIQQLANRIHSNSVFMDINYHNNYSYPAIPIAKQNIINGYQMFVRQAELQIDYWNLRACSKSFYLT